MTKYTYIKRGNQWILFRGRRKVGSFPDYPAMRFEANRITDHYVELEERKVKRGL